MQHPDEGMIHAWLDGALPRDEAERIEAHIITCATCASAVAEARGLIAGSSRIVSSLDMVPAGVVPTFAGKKTNRWLSMPARSAIAATILLGIGLYSTRVIGRNPKVDTELVDLAPVIATTNTPRPADSTVADATKQVPPQVASLGARTIGPARPRESRAAAPAVAVAPANQTAEMTKSAVAAPERVALGSTLSDSIGRQQMALAAAPPPMAAAASDIALRATPQKDSVAKRQNRMDEVRALGGGRSGAARVAGGVAGGRGGSARVSSSFAAAPSEELLSSFAGCYELDQSTDVLPAKFALVADSTSVRGEFPVRYLDGAGKPGERMVDAAWGVIDGRVVIRTAVRGVLLSLTKVGQTVAGESVVGRRTGRLTACGVGG